MQPPTLTNRTHTNSTCQSRREFLTKTVLLTGGILAFGLPTDRSSSVFATESRQYSQGGTFQYLLELDGAIVGPLNSMEGGIVSGEIITYQDGNDLFLRKRIGRLKNEDIVLTCGANLSPTFYQWLDGTLNHQGPRKNGAIVAVNQNGQIIDRREIQNALVKEVEFPALDAASNEPAYFKVTLTPERIRYLSASGQVSPPPQGNQAALSTSKFRLQIQGLEQACSFVQHIDSLVVSQEIISYRDGGSAGEPQVRGGRLQVGNVSIRLPQQEAGPFTAWFSEFVLQGQLAGNRKQGLLELLSPDGQSVLAAVTLGNIGIFSMSPLLPSSQSNAVFMVKVEMFCETMQLTQYPGSGSSRASQQTAPVQSKVPFTQQKVLPLQPKSRMQPKRQNVNPRLPQKR